MSVIFYDLSLQLSLKLFIPLVDLDSKSDGGDDKWQMLKFDALYFWIVFLFFEKDAFLV